MSKHVFIGVGTPQANPTVEIEFARYFNEPVFPMFTRLVSAADAPADRLIEYLEGLETALRSYDTLPLRVFAFACTASSYLVEDSREDEIIRDCENRFQVQVITATQAIRRELEGRGARRVAMLAPYPQDICDAAVEYWSRFGFDIVAAQRIDIGEDTRAIYEIEDDEVASALAAFDSAGADIVLLSGTGMPTISALRDANMPLISSNLCLATECLRRVHQWPAREAADVAAILRNS